MALTATLEFGDNSIKRYPKRYLIADYHLVFNRDYNDFAPEETARCERLEVVVIAPGKDDLTLFEWFISQDTQNGRVVIGPTADSNPAADDTQTIYFDGAQCFSLSESYDINDQRRRQVRLAIVAEHIEIDNITYICK